MDMSVNIAGVEWKNPVTVASGTFGSGEEFSEYVDLNRLGAVTTKGVANVPWSGNPTPRVAEVYGGMMNAIGLQNPGIDLFCKRDIPFLKQYDTLSPAKKQVFLFRGHKFSVRCGTNGTASMKERRSSYVKGIEIRRLLYGRRPSVCQGEGHCGL